MPSKTQLDPGQVRTGLNSGDLFLLEDVGGTPGMPAVDGSQLTNVGGPTPGVGAGGRWFLGTRLDYPSVGTGNLNEIQYTQVWLRKGITITKMAMFVPGPGGGGKEVRFGIYDQVDGGDFFGDPNDRVAQTASSQIVPGETGTFKQVSLTSPYAVADSGYYWLAQVFNAANPQVSLTGTSYEPGFAPRREATATGGNLPATASGLSNPKSAISLVMAGE